MTAPAAAARVAPPSARTPEAPRPVSRLGRSLGWNLVADVCARGASLWLSFYCARALPVSDFGRFTFAIALAQYAWLAGDAALNGGYATRELAREPAERARLAGGFLTARLLAALLLTAIAALALPFVPLPEGARPAVAAASVFFLAYAAFPDWLFRGVADFRTLAAANALYAAVVVGATALLLRRLPDPALAAFAWAGAFAVGGLLLLVVALRRGLLVFAWPSLADWWAHFRRSVVFALGSLFAIGCAQGPAILVGALAGPHETGLFAAGFRLVFSFINLFAVLWWPLLPALTRLQPGSADYRMLLKRVARGALLVALAAAAALTAFPRPLLTTLFGAGYLAGAPALVIGAWALPAYALSGLLEQAAIARGLERPRLAVQGLAFAVLVALAAFAVPRFGAAGAAASVVVTFAVSAAGFALLLRRTLSLTALLRMARGELVAAALLAVAWHALARMTALPWWVALPAGGAPVAAWAFVRGPFRRASLAAVRAPRTLWAHPLPPLPAEPLVSVVVAVRNEARWIDATLAAVLAQDWPALEVLVVDGDSDDGTAERVRANAARDPRVRLLRNPRRHVAPGLNLGLAAARGAVVVRVDGHCAVPSDYVSTCVRHLRDGRADCVGGPVRATGETALARAIACAMSTPFGVGGAAFRWAHDVREVDHLPFGAWRAEVFERIGRFDERLVRNQDDELSDRLRRAGGRILLDPAIPVTYWSRRDLRSLWRQYLGYGYWKVRVIRLRGGWPSSPRHLVPAAFLLTTLASVLAAAATGAWALPALVLGPYLAFLALATLAVARRTRDRAVIALPAVLATLHAAYGAGFLAALVRPRSEDA